MNPITLAVARNAHGGLYAGHFGDADFYAAYTLHANGTLLPGRIVPNTAKTLDAAHGAQGKMKSVLAALAPLHCVVAAQLSPNFSRMAREAPIQPVVVRCSSEEQLLFCLARECARLMEWVARRHQGDPHPDVLVLDAAPPPDAPL
jgi:hypothetical protein